MGLLRWRAIEATSVSARESSPRPEPSSRTARDLPVRAKTADERTAVPADALTRYLAELRHHPPISREEEHELAVRWREHGDVEAARCLVLANLRLAVKIAMEYRRAWTNTLDLIQESNVGLMEAVRRFDPYQGVKLSTYAAYWIRAYVLKYILDNFRMVRLGTTRAQRKLFFRLNKEKRELERQGFEAEPRLLAERLDVSEADVVDMDQRLSQGDLSLNAPRGAGDGSSELGDFLAGDLSNAEQNVADGELRRVFLEKVGEFSAGLEERDRRIMDDRILAEKPRTLQELGEEFGVSRERVRQLEARLVERLREYLRENLVDFEYYAPPKD
jgi:RNA polymerase sigma-32 factor